MAESRIGVCLTTGGHDIERGSRRCVRCGHSPGVPDCACDECRRDDRPIDLAQLAQLDALAAAATPGPWMGPRITDMWPPGWVGIYVAEEDGTACSFDIIGVTGRYDEETAKADAAYIAAASPDVIRKMIDGLRVALRAAKQWHDGGCVGVDLNMEYGTCCTLSRELTEALSPFAVPHD